MRRKLGSLIVGAVEWHLWADLTKAGLVTFQCETKAPLRKQSFELGDTRDSYLMQQYMPTLYDWCSARLRDHDKTNKRS